MGIPRSKLYWRNRRRSLADRIGNLKIRALLEGLLTSVGSINLAAIVKTRCARRWPASTFFENEMFKRRRIQINMYGTVAQNLMVVAFPHTLKIRKFELMPKVPSC